MKFKAPKELPMDSLEQSLEMLRGIQVVNEVINLCDGGKAYRSKPPESIINLLFLLTHGFTSQEW